MALITTEARAELVALYVGMFKAAPSADTLSLMVAAKEGGQTLLQIANQLAGATKLGFATVYPGLQTAEEFAATLTGTLLAPDIPAAAKTWATNWVISQVTGTKTRVQVIVEAVQAIRATTNTNYASSKAWLQNRTDVATYFAVDKNQVDPDLIDLQSVLTGVTQDPATVVTAKAAVDVRAANTSGKEFDLTAGGDIVVGTIGNDIIDGSTVANTWSAFDNIDGGGGTDTMNVLTGNAVPGAITLKNVEILNLNTTTGGYTIDTTSYTGLTNLNLTSAAAGQITVTGATTTAAKIVGTGASDVDVIGTGGALTVVTGAATVEVGATAVANAITSATIEGGTTVTVQDRSGTAAATGTKLETASLKGNTGAATITANGLKTLNLTNNTQDVTVTAAAGTRELTVGLNNATGGIVTDATATTLKVSATGTASSGVTLTAGAATSVAVDAAVNLTVADVNIGAAKSLSVAGAGKFTLSATTGVGVLTSIDAAANTGGVTITPALGTGVAYTGGAGVDTITLGATTKAIATGAGNDRVILSATTTALGSGGSVDAGEGTTDTLAFADGDDAGTASAGTTFEGTIAGFEVVELAGAAGAAVAVNLANLDDISQVKLSADVAQALTISNMASGGTLSATVSQTGTTAVGISNAAVGTTDVLNVSLAGAAAVNSGALTAADVETINYLTDDTATTPTGIAHISALTANAVKAITVKGDAGLALTNTSTTVTSFDASGVTKGAVTWTTGALAAAATIVGGAGANTIDASAATKAVTYTGGAGVDTITLGANNNSVTTAAGNDVIVVGNGNNTISAGDGNDSITLGSGANTVDTGTGTNTVVFGTKMAGLNVITLGSGVDTLDFNVVSTAAGFYPSVVGIAAGDKIDLVGASTGVAVAEATLGSKITLGGAASFANYLDAANAGLGGTNAIVNWFQFNGNTYVALDNSDALTYQDGTDLVIELVGLVDLSNSTLAAEVITIV